MKINVETLCDRCNACEYLELETIEFCTDNRTCIREQKCKNVHLCKNAVEVWKDSTGDGTIEEAFYDLVRRIGNIAYGKERWFEEDDDRWYDRETGKHISTGMLVELIIDEVQAEF